MASVALTRRFSAGASMHRQRRMSQIFDKEGHFKANLTTLFVGISAVFADENTAAVAIAIHDTVYLVDFSVKHIVLDDPKKTGHDPITDYVISALQDYEQEKFAKFIGAGLPTTVNDDMSPSLCSRLWLEIDIVPIVLRPDAGGDSKDKSFWGIKRVDEQADSMARKCIM